MGPFDAQALHAAITNSGARLEQTAPSAPTSERRIGKVPYIAMLLGELADLGTTLDAITSGRGREANPLMGSSPKRIALTKLIGTGGITGLMRLLDNQDHDKAAKILGYADGGLKGAIAVHNARVGR